MDKPHTQSVFYRNLKLGIWTSGDVEGWGFVQNMDVYADGSTNKGCFVKKQPNEYKRACILTKKQLTIGLNLLDVYPLGFKELGRNKTYSYVVVISECRLIGAFEEQIHTLKVTNNKAESAFMDIIQKESTNKSKWSPIQRKKRISRFENVPINSVTRKH